MQSWRCKCTQAFEYIFMYVRVSCMHLCMYVCSTTHMDESCYARAITLAILALSKKAFARICARLNTDQGTWGHHRFQGRDHPIPVLVHCFAYFPPSGSTPCSPHSRVGQPKSQLRTTSPNKFKQKFSQPLVSYSISTNHSLWEVTGAASWGVGAVDGSSVNAFLAAALTRVMRVTVPIPALASASVLHSAAVGGSVVGVVGPL